MPVDLQPTPQAAVLCAILAPDTDAIDNVVRRIEPLLGPVRERSAEYVFDYTSYYDREMGSGLVKQVVWFERLAPLDELAEIKRGTIRVERALAVRQSDGGELLRTVNIDPGLVTEQGLNLATTKFSGHRICIAPGLYAETTLLFQHGGCTPFEWTYGDYRAEAVMAFLLKVRATVLEHG